MSVDNQVKDHANQLMTEESQARVMASLLDSNAQNLSMQTLKRLEEGRVRAVNVLEGKTSGHHVNRDGTIAHWLSWTQHPRMLSASLLCAALLVGITLTHTLNQRSEQGDAFLLAAELPPEAFVDRGFEPWLNAKAEM